MTAVDDLLSNVKPIDRVCLQHIRSVIKEALPDAEEVMTYGMPGFKYKKKYFIAFAAFKDHLSIFPGAEAVVEFDSQLSTYKHSKGTIQFTSEHPLPDELLTSIITHRKQAIDQKVK